MNENEVILLVLGIFSTIPAGLLIAAAIAQSRRESYQSSLCVPCVPAERSIETTAIVVSGPRRLEMIADRVEAVCATHKVNGRVHGGWIRRGRLVMIVTTSPFYDLRKLNDDIALSLGVPVTVFCDAVICEVAP